MKNNRKLYISLFYYITSYYLKVLSQTIREFPTALITIKVKFGISLGPIEKLKFRSNQIVFQVLYIYGDELFYKKVMKLLDNISFKYL